MRAAWVVELSPDAEGELPEAKLANAPVVLVQAVVVVVSVLDVPRAVLVAPVLMVHPVGKPDAILLKFWVYGEVPSVTCASTEDMRPAIRMIRPKVARSVKNFFMRNGLIVTDCTVRGMLKQPKVSVRPKRPMHASTIAFGPGGAWPDRRSDSLEIAQAPR